jgi:hypothetical protein
VDDGTVKSGGSPHRMCWPGGVLTHFSQSYPPRCGKPSCQIVVHGERSPSSGDVFTHRDTPRNPQKFLVCPLSLHRQGFLVFEMRQAGQPVSGRREALCRPRQRTWFVDVAPLHLASAAIASMSGRSWANTHSSGFRPARNYRPRGPLNARTFRSTPSGAPT